MTREEAILHLGYLKDFKTPAQVETLDMAMEALSADVVSIHEDGTLEVKVPNAQRVGRVLVVDTDSHIGGGLFYPDDAVQGEWVEEDEYGDLWACNQCGFASEHKDNFCPNCGAKMKGVNHD